MSSSSRFALLELHYSFESMTLHLGIFVPYTRNTEDPRDQDSLTKSFNIVTWSDACKLPFVILEVAEIRRCSRDHCETVMLFICYTRVVLVRSLEG